MSKSTISLLLNLLIVSLIATNHVSALPEDLCKDSSNPEACERTIERLKNENKVDPNKTIRKIIYFGLQRSLTLKANMTDWVHHRKLVASEYAAIKGCLDDIDVLVDDLRKTHNEVDDLAEARKTQDMQSFMFHSGNIKTWLQNGVNALLSCQNDDLAMPGLEGKVKEDVFRRVQDLIIATQLAVWTVELPSHGSDDG